MGAPDEPKAKPFFAIEEEPKEVQPQQTPSLRDGDGASFHSNHI